EDDGLRMLHHFYDPVHNRGLSIANEWQSSKGWARDTLAQASYSGNIFSNPVAAVSYATVKGLYGSDTDYSWERAVYEYAWGDKERALKSLGSVLHLIQDASVPDHTRNDPHPPAFDWGSPYENWTTKFDRINTDIASKLKNKSPILLSTLDEYFDSAANYSNNNFFSKDTVPNKNNEYSTPVEKFTLPETLSNGELGSFVYSVDHGIPYKLALIKIDGILLSKEYFLTDPDNLILTDYWRLLSEQAVLHGAGVVKLFFDEVEKEKKTKELYRKNRNIFERISDSTKERIYGAAVGLYGGSVPYGELDEGLQGERSEPVQNDSVEVVPVVSQEPQGPDAAPAVTEPEPTAVDIPAAELPQAEEAPLPAAPEVTTPANEPPAPDVA
ncbi:MAG: hypothetical protein AAB727_01895, partial [Patescibacteria group bacterium]